MRTWKLAPHRMACGAVPQCWIQKDEPYLELRGASSVWAKRRCAAHAAEAVPPVIEGHEVQAPAMTSLRQLVRSVEQRDIKMAQAGRDE